MLCKGPPYVAGVVVEVVGGGNDCFFSLLFNPLFHDIALSK